MSNKVSNYRIEDIAAELGVNKSTVSRAISGKGRISRETRERVNRFIEDHGCHLNSSAKGVTQSRTFNIGVAVYPHFSFSRDSSLFLCLNGIMKTAGKNNYDVLLFNVDPHDVSNVQRILSSRKVDGFILSHTGINDPIVQLLQEYHIPSVALDCSADSPLICVGFDEVSAADAMAQYLMGRGARNISILVGNTNRYFNRNRLGSFCSAVEQCSTVSCTVYDGIDIRSKNEAAIKEALSLGSDCLMCMDSIICRNALDFLKIQGLRVPEDISVACFPHYEDPFADDELKVCSIKVPAEQIGQTACRVLLDAIANRPTENVILKDYEILEGNSVK